MARKFEEVAQQVKDLLPENTHTILKNRIAKLIISAGYKAPEQMWEVWGSLSSALNDNLCYPPKEEFEKKIMELMRGDMKVINETQDH